MKKMSPSGNEVPLLVNLTCQGDILNLIHRNLVNHETGLHGKFS